jgi:Na+/pantothenate symporter
VTPEWSRRFVQRLNWIGVFWFGMGAILTCKNPEAMSAFFQVFFFTVLDLVFLVLIGWALFFAQITRRTKAVRAMFFFTFKLVSLGLLAITLKRLRNAPTYAEILGVLFLCIGPLLAGVLSRIRNKD